MQSTCLSEQQLQALQLGNLPEEALNECIDHLENCPRCETRARQLDSTLDPILAAIRQPGISPSTPPPRGSFSRAVLQEANYSFLRPPEKPDELGRLGDYRVLHLLGRGGMAYVFHAEDIVLRRAVALKVMKPDLICHPQGAQRFLREAQLMASIKHDNIATVYQVGQEGPVVFVAMELLEGESLDDRLRRREPISPAEVLRLATEIAGGLTVVHGHGLVHRDVKPGNIWLEAPAARVKILDFGLARSLSDSSGLTNPGTVMGTPAFMSPEQARGEVVDVRSDLFSLGAVLYYLCTGVKPFASTNTMIVLTELATCDPRPIRDRNPAIPAELSDLVMQLMAKKPEARPASAEAVLDRLQLIRVEEPAAPPVAIPVAAVVPAKPRSRRGQLALVLTLLIGVLAWGSWKMLAHRAAPEPAPVISAPIYCNDLPVVAMEAWPFGGRLPEPPVPDEDPRWPPPLGGHRVFVRGVASPHGIWMHLPHEEPKQCGVTFRLDGKYRTFQTRVSLNDGPSNSIPLTFSIHGDGRLLWESKPVSSQADEQTSPTLNVQGVHRLRLSVTGTGDERGSHAVWIEPTLFQ